MKYLCLAYYDLKKFEALPKPDFDAIVTQCKERDQALRDTGRVVLLGSLSMPQEWKAIRPTGGVPAVTDGPFSEAKELVGAFFILEARDMAEAVDTASKHPAASLGEKIGWGIDVRACPGFEQF